MSSKLLRAHTTVLAGCLLAGAGFFGATIFGSGRLAEAQPGSAPTREPTTPRPQATCLHPSLERRLADPGEDRLSVLIRYRFSPQAHPSVDDRPLDRMAFVGVSPSEIAAAVLERQAELERVTDLVHRRLVGEQGLVSPRLVGPFVADRLPAALVARLCDNDEVVFVGPYGERDIRDYPTLAEAIPTTRTDKVHALGFTGSGQRVAVIEAGKLWLPQACLTIHEELSSTPTAPGAHMTQAIAIIGNTWKRDAVSGTSSCDAAQQGYAPDAEILVGNAEYDPAPAGEHATDWAAGLDWAKHPSRAAQVVSMSFHNPSDELALLSPRDVFFDYWVTRYPLISTFVSAGNKGQANEVVYAAGKGYNIVAVADVFNDGDGNRSNDLVNPHSTWRNPPVDVSGDRELPEIAAPGSRYQLTVWDDYGGTSAATPAAAGIAALLLEKSPHLGLWPEAVRALLYAGADYELADGHLWGPSGDGSDGAGLVNAERALLAAAPAAGEPRANGHTYGAIWADDFVDPTEIPGIPGRQPLPDNLAAKLARLSQLRVLQPPIEIPVELSTWKQLRCLLPLNWRWLGACGKRVRAAVSWSSDVDSPHGVSVLTLDLDLVAVDPEGAIADFSSTSDNNYEIVDFTATKNGTYRLALVAVDVPPNPPGRPITYFGLAWTSFSYGTAPAQLAAEAQVLPRERQ